VYAGDDAVSMLVRAGVMMVVMLWWMLVWCC
jgi:hypothetical protein